VVVEEEFETAPRQQQGDTFNICAFNLSKVGPLPAHAPPRQRQARPEVFSRHPPFWPPS
jgi:hypothetical protein